MAKPEGDATIHRFETPGGEMPTWEKGEKVATRKAYGEALAARFTHAASIPKASALYGTTSTILRVAGSTSTGVSSTIVYW